MNDDIFIEIEDEEEYRDSISTVDAEGKRVWVYPKKPSGKYYTYRTILSVLLLALLFGLPFVKIDGDPIFLFNILERKFIVFGKVFTPQDFHLLALGMLSLMLFIVLFTVVFGRLFCGWVCPQTIFMEMVFRKVEYWIEGDYNAQKRLNKSPWNWNKIWRKTVKHVIFFSIAVLIANTFLAWIIGIDSVFNIISEPISIHFQGFLAMVLFSFVFYSVFAFMREQVCIAVCPYGRLQGVLLVKNSIVVIYDWIRGEPRGKLKKKTQDLATEAKGDCIDCNLCVKVCPTGIDIRNGTQLECVNCTACMDACDEVMRKIDKPEGLIRYDSVENIEVGKTKLFTPRVMAYSVVLILLLVLQGFLYSTRENVEAVILRTPGMLYQKPEEGVISNLYNYQIINKTSDSIVNINLQVREDKGRIRSIGKIQNLPKLESVKGTFFIEIPEDKLLDDNTQLFIDVYTEDELLTSAKTNFVGPIK